MLEKDLDVNGATSIQVPDVRIAMAAISEIFYASPSKKLRVIGVTGTNGKTTTAYLIEAIISAHNKKTGLLGTIKYKINGDSLPVLATTPEAPDLQRLLSKMVARKVKYAIMEVSSHALELNRVSGCDFDIAVMTNITGDHYDFHQNKERYLFAKAKLFSQLGGSFLKGPLPRFAVLNRDDPYFEYLLRQTTVQSISYGIKNPADVEAKNIEVREDGINFLLFLGKRGDFINLTGYFNLYNALATASVALEGVPLSTIRSPCRVQGTGALSALT